LQIYLFVFSRKHHQQNDDIYHDVSDQKSISDSSNIYSEDYQNNSNIINGSSLSLQKNKANDSNSPSKFNTRLFNFYKQLNQNLNISNKVLRKSAKSTNDIISCQSNTPTKSFNINEYNPNDVDVKFEKDIPIDKLKLFKISTTSTRSAANLFKQKSNIDHDTSRLENTYVSNPTDVGAEHNPSSKF
jgi:hypothetical protein